MECSLVVSKYLIVPFRYHQNSLIFLSFFFLSFNYNLILFRKNNSWPASSSVSIGCCSCPVLFACRIMELSVLMKERAKCRASLVIPFEMAEAEARESEAPAERSSESEDESVSWKYSVDRGLIWYVNWSFSYSFRLSEKYYFEEACS